MRSRPSFGSVAEYDQSHATARTALTHADLGFVVFAFRRQFENDGEIDVRAAEIAGFNGVAPENVRELLVESSAHLQAMIDSLDDEIVDGA